MGARSLVHVQYLTDEGLKIAIRQEQQIQEAAGNPLVDGTEVRGFERMKLRKIHATWFSAGGAGQAVGQFNRSIVISDPTNPLWTNADKQISLPDYESVPGAGQTTPNVRRDFTVTGRTGEKVTF